MLRIEGTNDDEQNDLKGKYAGKKSEIDQKEKKKR